ncbi:MAG: hypothetical protein AB1430_06545 [Pseudomonadota bacterium]
MERNADFRRLCRALDEAVQALPESACAAQQAALRRQCREVLLMLLQARERARHLARLFDEAGRGC